MAYFTVLLGCYGVFCIYRRLQFPDAAFKFEAVRFPKVSIIIPALNEEESLPRLLESIQKLDYELLDVTVVNDRSTDDTRRVALSYGVQVLDAPTPPHPRWVGKSWACHVGSTTASGEYVMFVDADTTLYPDSLKCLVGEMLGRDLDLICPLLYHDNHLWWERLLGPFHLLYLIGSAAFHPPTPNRLYANGQCLMFKRAFYQKKAGHSEVATEVAEDMAIAKLCLKKGGRYQVFHGKKVYSVSMYKDFKSFIQGWKRIFRVGLHHTNTSGTVEVVCAIFAILGVSGGVFSKPGIFLAICSGLLLLRSQRKIGSFHWLGCLIAPLSAFIFSMITTKALYERLRRKKIFWKNRVYSDF